jgi:hypothetical protein
MRTIVVALAVALATASRPLASRRGCGAADDWLRTALRRDPAVGLERRGVRRRPTLVLVVEDMAERASSARA